MNEAAKLKEFRSVLAELGFKLCGDEPKQSGEAKHIDMDAAYDYQEKVINPTIRGNIRKVISQCKKGKL